MSGLELTGERTLPGVPDENYWFRRHEAAYLAVATFLTGARVLEAGAGEGYGADLLAARARARIVAVDYDPAVAQHARRRYASLPVVRADLQRLGVASASVDAVVSLQVIEHLHDQPGFLEECHRVLRPGGTLIVSTPNRLTFSPGDAPPRNPFHTRELAPEELSSLLAPRFIVTRLWGLHHGWRLRAYERAFGALVAAQLTTPPGQWPARLRRAVHRVTARDFRVGPLGLTSSLDLIAVAWRRG